MLLRVRSRRYFFDLDVIRRPLATKQAKRPSAANYRYLPKHAMPPDGGVDRGLNRLKAEGRAGHPLGL